jgi:NTP pyrophosphatase (non-canonical NTP hydrolase)
MDLDAISRRIREIREDCEWMQFRTAKNLAISISIEASELLERFQWLTPEQSDNQSETAKSDVADEIADVAIYLIELAENLGIDLEAAIQAKLTKNTEKCPVTLSKGNAKKIHGVLNYEADPSATCRRAGHLSLCENGNNARSTECDLASPVTCRRSTTTGVFPQALHPHISKTAAIT